MKKLILLATAAFMSMAAYAASPIQIVDAKGNNLTGETVIATGEYDDLEDCIMASSGLYLKNTSDQGYLVQFSFQVEDLGEFGTLSFCFGGGCATAKKDGIYTHPSETYPLAPGATEPFMDHWGFTAEDGLTYATYRVSVYPVDGDKLPDDPKVDVVYVAGNAGIGSIFGDKIEASSTYYDLSGREVQNPSNGIFIKRSVYTDGSVKNVKLHIK